jgi:hypothetical protein
VAVVVVADMVLLEILLKVEPQLLVVAVVVVVQVTVQVHSGQVAQAVQVLLF